MDAMFWAAAIALVVVVFGRLRSGRRRGTVGPAAAGSIYDWLNDDKRRAVELIVEQRAAARDPEDKDGNLPELAGTPLRRDPPSD